MPLENDVRNAMRNGGTLDVEFDAALNDLASGTQDVYFHSINADLVRIDTTPAGGELVTILWMPYNQGNITTLREKMGW